MALQEISAKITDGEKFTVNFDVPETVKEATDRWGEDVVYSRFKGSLVIDVQSGMRAIIRADDFSEEKLQRFADGWTPDVKTRGRSQGERVLDFLDSLSAEDRVKFLEKYEG